MSFATTSTTLTVVSSVVTFVGNESHCNDAPTGRLLAVPEMAAVALTVYAPAPSIAAVLASGENTTPLADRSVRPVNVAVVDGVPVPVTVIRANVAGSRETPSAMPW